MTASSTTARFDHAFFANLADYLVVGVAVALPWSTTATSICIVGWLIVLLPTLDAATVKRELLSPAGGLPVLLCCLGAVGMLWADVDWAARFGGLDGFIRLLVIPLLLAQFRRSVHGGNVIYGFLIASAALLVTSYLLVLTPGLPWRGKDVVGVPVHDDIFQGSEFLICGFGALGYAVIEGGRHKWRDGALFGLVGALFLANFGFAEFSRVVLVVTPVLAALLGWRWRRWKGLLGMCLIGAVLWPVAWVASPMVRWRTETSLTEAQEYFATNKGTPIGEHIAFLKESLDIVAAAPIIGHGTGSITKEFREIAIGKTGASAEATVNPHNQTFAVAIQLGIVGMIALWAMWIAHLLLFRGGGIVAWLGTVVVVENIISSTVHSHLFDFNNGWLYVFGVGVLGGAILRQRDALSVQSAVTTPA
jgi:O-antigen ligase